MRRSLVLVALIGSVGGCAHAGETSEQAPDREVVTVGSADGSTMVLSVTREDYVTTATIPTSRERVWELLPAAYAAVGLPAPAADRSIWTVAVRNHPVMRQLGDVRMSHLLDCGTGMTGLYADKHRIRLSVRTWVESADSAATVRTRVEATATSVQGTDNTFPCSSSGQIEKQIANALFTGALAR